MNPAATRTVAGKYQLERQIGQGGMGTVWAATDLHLRVPVAIKFMDAEQVESEELRSRFEREARAAARLRSPHVVQVIEHGIDEGTPYIVMERLEGEDLSGRLKRERRLTLPAAAVILTQAAKALRLAQELGIVHRDLKPGNVFISRVGDDEIVKLLDFGIAKSLQSSPMDQLSAPTQSGVIMGSPNYMSPEQLQESKSLDHRSDLWSLAVILFRAVTGVMAFRGDSLAEIIMQICRDPLPVPSQVAPDLPPEIDRFFERALARDPDERFQTATEMAAVFAAIARGEPGAEMTNSGTFNGPLPVWSPPSGQMITELPSSDALRVPTGPSLPSITVVPVVVRASKGDRSGLRMLVFAAAAVVVLGLGFFVYTQVQRFMDNTFDDMTGTPRRKKPRY